MTAVMVRRKPSVYDEAGSLVKTGVWVDHLALVGKVSSASSGESVEVGRNAVITTGTVFVRDLPFRPDILHTDRVKIWDATYQIEGEVGVWERETLGTWAVQFGVKRVVG